ncbi:uncharacterized protein JCM6883_003029 [Sporobolomyces salmoneus]|uniref:uncharacterized protein n=1 Tax=Sporobolomyces salmoneus TaxID=183962 RepID=UPI0031739FA2
MSDAINAYLGLSTTQRSSTEGITALSRVLQALSQGHEPSIEQRRKLIAALLSFASPRSETLSTESNSLLLYASTLKFLGRSPAGSEELARENGIEILLALGGVRRLAQLPRTEVEPDDSTREDDDDTEATASRALQRREEDPLKPYEAEALRCLCNVLILHPSARDVFPNVVLADDKRQALKGLVRILGCEGAGFLGGRLLFLLTSKPSEAVAELVLDEGIVEVLAEYAHRYVAISKSESLGSQLTSGPMPKPEDVIREHLKLTYTLMLQFGRSNLQTRRGSRPESVGKKKKRFWSSKQSGSNDSGSQLEELPEESQTSHGERRDSSSSPSKNPLSIAKRVVGAVKNNSNSSSPTPSTTSAPRSSSPTPPSKPSSPADTASEGVSPDSLSLSAAQYFLPIFRPYLALAVSFPLYPSGSSPKEPNATVKAALNALLNFPVELEELDGSDYSWIQYLPPRTDSQGIVLRAGGVGSLGERLLELLQTSCNAFFPVDTLPPKSSIVSTSQSQKPTSLPASPDDWITTGQGEASKIEELLGPVVLLLRKLSMIGEANEMFRFVLFPPDLDRSKPINRQPTLTGHLVRLLSSVFLPNTAFGVGEFLYNLADRSPEKLCALIGYGVASGFLQNRGELIPPPPFEDGGGEGEGDSTSRPINPITGAFEPPEDSNRETMTEEEKEREAEKLYTLFDRMERTGIMSAENPVNKARQAGKFEDTKEERAKELERLRKEDEEVERAVEKEMAEWKARRGKASAAAADNQ